MKSFTTLQSLFTNLTNNTSTSNASLGGQLINDQHRYTLQKYFDNERTATTTTVGGMSLTLTGSLAINATSATLTVAWAYPTCTQLVNFSNSQQRSVLFTNGSAAITWTGGLTATATTAISTVGVQSYSIPATISKIKNDTINVGQLKYQPVPIMTRAEWDTVNFLPYTSDIPEYFFIYNGKLEIYPIPSTTGNILTFNYQTRVSDLTFNDYSTGTLAAGGMVAGSTAVTGLATSWLTTGLYPSNTDIGYYNLKIKANPPYGDGIWYPIRQFNSDTSLTLDVPVVNAPNITAATTYTIGQFPLLSEDFHDMLVYGAIKTYYSSIVKDVDRYKEFDALYSERLVLLEAYAGTKSVNVDLGTQPNMTNPNLFIYGT
jgi:hypothetical protein